MPKISLIVPIYNGAKYLKQCVDNILGQTFGDFEVIFVNDCSPDNSIDIIKEYAEKDSRIRIINNKKNIGQGASRNVGIKHAKGDFLMFQDQDDWFEKTAFEECYNQITKNNNDFVMFLRSDYNQEDGSYKLIENNIVPLKEKNLLDCPHIVPYELKGRTIVSCYAWCAIYNRKFIRKNRIKFSKQRNAEDIPFYIKAWVFAKDVSIINKSLYNYRIYPEQQTNVLKQQFMPLFKAREEAFKEYLKSPHKKEHLEGILIYYIRSVYRWYKRNAQQDPEIKRAYYNEMQKVYKKLDNKYDIDSLAEYIDYETFVDFTVSWNEKRNIIYEKPGKIKLKRSDKKRKVYVYINNEKVMKSGFLYKLDTQIKKIRRKFGKNRPVQIIKPC